jgi:hypothetical protein
MPEDRAAKRRALLGEMYPKGQRQNGRWWQPPVSVKQAKARVRDAERLFGVNVRDGLDVGWAQEILDEVEDDYREMVIHGEINEMRKSVIAAQIQELSAEIAEIQAEAVVRQAMRDIEDGDL